MPLEAFIQRQSTEQFHLQEKMAHMADEYTVSFHLRGFNGTSELFTTGDNFPRALGKSLIPSVQNLGAFVTLLNIGDGLGLNGQGIREVMQEQQSNVRLLAIDLSPALLAAQRSQGSAELVIPGSAVNIPFPRESIGGIINNEMIADLDTIQFSRTDALSMRDAAMQAKTLLTEGEGEKQRWNQQKLSVFIQETFHVPKRQLADWTEVIGLILTYDLPIPEQKATSSNVENNDIIGINTGSIHFLEEISRVLVPGGFAWISEYGSLDPTYYPIDAGLISHEEWSIKFDHLILVAQKLGLHATVQPLADALPFDKDAWYTTPSLRSELQAVTIHELYEHFPHVTGITDFHALRSKGKETRGNPKLQELAQQYGLRIYHDEEYQQLTEKRTQQHHLPPYMRPLTPLVDLLDTFYVLVLQK